MPASRTLIRAAAVLAIAAIGTTSSSAIASPSSGVSFSTLTVQNFLDPDQINSDRIKFQTKDATIVRMQSATWAADSTSGWHHHPGIIIFLIGVFLRYVTDVFFPFPLDWAIFGIYWGWALIHVYRIYKAISGPVGQAN